MAITFLSIFLILAVLSFILKGDIYTLPFLAFLGSITGFYMGVVFPFSMTFKVCYILGAILSLGCIIYGYKILDKKVYLFVFGVLLWIVLGFIGLGTGT